MPSVGAARVNLQYQVELGVVPEFEAREAAVYVHIPWLTFLGYPHEERAKIIAHYRLHGLIESHELNEASRQHGAGSGMSSGIDD